MSGIDDPTPIDSPLVTIDGTGNESGMSASITIDQIQSPLDAGVASISGSYESSSNVTSISVTWRDRQGTTVVAAASFSGGAWSVVDVDISTLHPGEVIAMVTLTAVAGSAFDAASTIIDAGYPHVCGSPWSTHLDVVRNYQSVPVSDDDMDASCWIASDILYRFTGSRWPGICHVDKLRPQARWRQYDRPAWWQRVAALPLWRYGYCSCNRGKDFGCNALPEIALPHAPIHPDSVVVLLDGVRFTDFTIRDDRWLIRTDTSGWPCCQRTELPDTEKDTWSVSYSYGRGPDAGGVRASATLGYELALADAGVDACRLPRRIRTLTRGGTSIGLLDPMTLFDSALTGVTEVDLWTKSVEIGAKRRPATITVPGRSPRYRRE